MKVIVSGDELPRSYTIELSLQALLGWLAALAAAVVLLLVAIVVAVNRGHKLDASRDLLESLQAQALYDQYQLDHFYAYADSLFNEYARQAGALQSRMARIETLGARLAKMGDFSDFDFSTPPPLGGPEEQASAPDGQVDILAFSRQWKGYLQQREEELKAIESLLAGNPSFRETYIAGKPVESGWLTSGFGKRIDPFSGRMAWHNGVDYTSPEDTAIHAVAAGVVSWVGMRDNYGQMVEIDHGDGLVTRYAHNHANLVKAGDKISKGQVIALMGNTGRSTGNHVHFEVLRQGKPVDPIQYIYRRAL